MASLISSSRKASTTVFSTCRQCLRHARAPFFYQPFSTSSNRTAASTLGGIAADAQRNGQEKMRQTYMQQLLGESSNRNARETASTTNNKTPSMHHLYVYTTKHNTHLTLMTPDQKCILSLSSGNIGFRKSARGTYDAAYQLTAYFLNQIHGQPEWDQQIKSLEVVLRGFGVGREAFTKAILGTEGRLIRGRIVRVSDATRLKFGGTRSPKPRRLG